jgi:hypothetical protein
MSEAELRRREVELAARTAAADRRERELAAREAELICPRSWRTLWWRLLFGRRTLLQIAAGVWLLAAVAIGGITLAATAACIGIAVVVVAWRRLIGLPLGELSDRTRPPPPAGYRSTYPPGSGV